MAMIGLANSLGLVSLLAAGLGLASLLGLLGLLTLGCRVRGRGRRSGGLFGKKNSTHTDTHTNTAS